MERQTSLPPGGVQAQNAEDKRKEDSLTTTTTEISEINRDNKKETASFSGSNLSNNYEESDIEDEDEDNDNEVPKYINHDVCDCCGETGSLICCDSCPTSLHFECSDPPVIIEPKGKWFCPKCMSVRVKKKKT